MPTTEVREARPGDAAAIADLVDLLASLDGSKSPCTPAFVVEHLARENTTVLLAERDGVAVGLLSYSLSSSLYHAGLGAMIEELAVWPAVRRQGVADALMAEASRRFLCARIASIVPLLPSPLPIDPNPLTVHCVLDPSA